MMTADQEAAIARAIASRKLVEAIALVRTATGASLPDAKLYVMALAGSLPNDAKTRAGVRASFALDERTPGETAAVRITVIVTLAIGLSLAAAIVALIAHAHVISAP